MLKRGISYFFLELVETKWNKPEAEKNDNEMK